MITLTSIEMWSDADEAMRVWALSLEEKTINGHAHKAIVARYKTETHRFSPNLTDEELLKIAPDPSGSRRK